MTYFIRQSFTGGVHLEQDGNTIILSDDDIAKIVRARLLFEKFDWDDLVFALTLFQNSTGRKQASYETVIDDINVS